MFGGSSQLHNEQAVIIRQIIEHSSDNEKVLGSSRKLGEATADLIDGSKKRICELSFEFQSLHVIKGAVMK